MLSQRIFRSPVRSALRQKGRVFWWWLLVVLALAAGGGWWWKQRQAGPDGSSATAGASTAGARGPGRFSAGGQVQPVSVGVVRRQDVRVMVQAIGTMSARATAVVRAKVSNA